MGVIASTMHDAYSVADLILSDFQSPRSSSPSPSGTSAAGSELLERTPPVLGTTTKRVVHWKDWLRLDEAERIAGQKRGKEREKVLGVREMLEVMG